MKFIFYLFIFCLSVTLSAQTPTIKFQKNLQIVYFFPKNTLTNSIINSSSDLFYLVVPDSLKKNISIRVENARLLKTGNDSIVKINYMPGLKYESMYVIEESQIPNSKKIKKEFNFITLINGTATNPKNEIHIQIINKKEEKPVIEDLYFYQK